MKTTTSILICLLFTAVSSAQTGTLDKRFGDSGFVTNPTGFYCSNITIQPDKKILAGSESINGLAIIRYLPDGNIDYDFGDSGLAIAAVSFPAGIVAVTHEGKILAVAGGGVSNGDVILIKFTADGKVDSSFGINGISTIDFGKYESVGAMQLQTDGKIVVAGTQIKDLTNPDTKLFVARFNADGSTDNSFGQQGIVVNSVLIDTKFLGNATSLALQSDGKIVAGATTFTGGENNSFILWKYNTDGSLDNSFGINGTVVTDFSLHDDDLFSLALQSDGKIVAGGIGDLSNAPGNMLFIRYNMDGSIDRSFGGSGTATVKFEDLSSQVNTVLIDNNDNIIGVGSAAYNTPTKIALTRLTSNGKIDSAFGANGIQITAFSGSIFVDNAVLQDNKIIAGNANYLNGYRPLLARYNNILTQKQIIITKIRHWIQHHNGFTWDNNSSISSYVMQRSYDGIHFNSITKINVGNNSSYTYADPNPLSGNNYYRLQTTNVNGAVAYS
ncbi:MAG: hypothetical protein ABJB05_16665, partial [Parafilimonas sp.]